MTIAIGILIMAVIALCIGFYKNEGFDILLELKLYSNPYFNIGVSFMAYPEEEYIEEEFTIGLFFFNLVIIFYKPYR